MTDDPLAVTDRESLAAFIDRLRRDLQDNPAGWENPTLDRYLEALAAHVRSLPGWSRNVALSIDPDRPDWRLFAVALAGASVYE